MIRLRHRVIAATGERIAREHAADRHERAARGAVALDRLDRVFGARRGVAAGRGERRAQPGLVEPKGPEHESLHLSTPWSSRSTAPPTAPGAAERGAGRALRSRARPEGGAG